jgi:hypothetical protein
MLIFCQVENLSINATVFPEFQSHWTLTFLTPSVHFVLAETLFSQQILSTNLCKKYWYKQQYLVEVSQVGRSVKLLLVLGSAVNPGFGYRWDPWPYFCSFQQFYVFWNRVSSWNERTGLTTTGHSPYTRVDSSGNSFTNWSSSSKHTHSHTHILTVGRSVG